MPETLSTADLRPDLDFARSLDERDPMRAFRSRFAIPRDDAGNDLVYLCGNSLGLMPHAVRDVVNGELDAWSTLAVEAHFDAERPWYSYHELFRDSGARMVGALPGEVVMMNSLTVNLHLLMVTFHQPAGDRRVILMEDGAFPSDTYAVTSHVRARGGDPATDVAFLTPRAGEHLLRTEDIVARIEELGDRLSLVMLGGVNFRTGQLLDLEAITAAAHRVGARCGFDLAHAFGNVPLKLHDWNVDFACWCSYKYGNSGPGALAGAFVHERHGNDLDLPRFAGWWGNDPETRFKMHLIPEFTPREGADGWQLSNPPIMAAAPLVASLALFEEAGIDRLREKSRLLTGYLEFLLRERLGDAFEVITPADVESRGCQLSIRVLDRPRERFDALRARGVVGDFRPPDVIRLAPVPLYNTFEDVWRTAEALGAPGG